MNKTLKFERNNVIINRPLSMVNDMLNKKQLYWGKQQSVGLALCHGHMHTIKTLAKIKDNDYWYCVDRNPYTYPDYVCDITDVNNMLYFPDSYFNVVLSEYCYMRDLDFDKYFSIIHRVLKNNGIFISTELPSIVFNAFDSITMQIACDIIDEHFGEEGINSLFIEYKDKLSNKDDLYRSILLGNFKYFGKKKLMEKINHIKLEFTKKLLIDHQFKFVKIQGKFLIAEKLVL